MNDCSIIIKIGSPQYLPWDDLDQGQVVATEENSLQYCIDAGILKDRRFCNDCQQWMEVVECSKEKYSDGCCWRCPGGSHYALLRLDSMIVQENGYQLKNSPTSVALLFI